MRLFWKIYLLSLFSLLFCSVLLTAIVSYREASNSLARLQDEQRLLAITAASQVETGYFDQVWPFEMLSGLARASEFVTWQIIDGSGHVTLAFEGAGATVEPVIESSDPQLVEVAGTDTEMWVVPLRMRDGSHPWQFRLGYHTKQIRAQLRSTILTNAAIGSGLAILFIGMSLVFTHRLLRPLNSLTRAAGELERGKLEIALPEAGRDEIGQLVAGFAAMVHSIRERDVKIGEHLESLEAARAKLEERVAERTRELQASQMMLVSASRRAGMAEVASNVLHNVGNVLNSVNVSASLLADRVSSSRMVQVAKIGAMLAEHGNDLGDYLCSDARGKLLPKYIAELGERLQAERASMIEEICSLTKDIDHIKRVVDTQQSYAKVEIDLGEVLALDDVLEDAIRISASTGRNIAITRELEPTPPVKVDRHKLLHILVNLINNAKQAVANVDGAQVRLCIALDGAHAVRIDVIDNGVGIPGANLPLIFNHGFTTKPDGHGFGLHGAALLAQELGGSLSVHSDGEGLGARFRMVLPYVADARAA